METIGLKKYENSAKDFLKIGIQPNEVKIGDVSSAMELCYVNGFNAADNAWREAIFEYCKKHEIVVGSVFSELLNIINKE